MPYPVRRSPADRQRSGAPRRCFVKSRNGEKIQTQEQSAQLSGTQILPGAKEDDFNILKAGYEELSARYSTLLNERDILKAELEKLQLAIKQLIRRPAAGRKSKTSGPGAAPPGRAPSRTLGRSPPPRESRLKPRPRTRRPAGARPADTCQPVWTLDHHDIADKTCVLRRRAAHQSGIAEPLDVIPSAVCGSGSSGARATAPAACAERSVRPRRETPDHRRHGDCGMVAQMRRFRHRRPAALPPGAVYARDSGLSLNARRLVWPRGMVAESRCGNCCSPPAELTEVFCDDTLGAEHRPGQDENRSLGLCPRRPALGRRLAAHRGLPVQREDHACDRPSPARRLFPGV